MQEARSAETEPVDLMGGVCIVEGIHAFNPALTSLVPAKEVYRVYAGLREEYCEEGRRVITPKISACAAVCCGMLPPGAAARPRPSPCGTECWTERPGISRVFKSSADFLLDTSFTYELGIIAQLLQIVRRQFTLEGHNAELWDDTARRFEHVQPLPLELLPEDSMLREFYPPQA